MDYQIEKIRNIGISAHIDSGKTTLTERILYYCNKIHAMHEVRGKDGCGATMDFMELERERGITISSASTNVDWNEHPINIIDTPGHVDFTIEVENALRVLDGAILVLCSVGGVQSQTSTVDRQMKRYKVPCIAFVNKCDRTGANPLKVKDQIIEKLGRNAVMLQLPIGLEDKMEGIIDLVRMKAVYFDGPSGDDIRIEEIPAAYIEQAKEYHEILLDKASLYSDRLTEAWLNGTVEVDMIDEAIRKGTISMEMTPVLLGSAYKNKGVQSLLDAIVEYLPNPTEVENHAFDLDHKNKEIVIESDPNKPLVALTFKLDSQTYGQLTYLRVYQGTLRKGDDIYNISSKRRTKVGRLIRMHANSMEDIDAGYAGDIVALFGIDCSLGDTFTNGDINVSMKPTFIPEPIISLAIKSLDKKSFDNMSKALNRFVKEDPTFKAYIDQESGETIIKGMGELHLDVYIERLKREYKVALESGMPQVSYRETISEKVNFEYTHKKQSGGRGQYAKIAGSIEPNEDDDNIFVDNIKGGVIPQTFVPSIEKGYIACMDKGGFIGFPIVGTKLTINDGNYHPVDSSNTAFEVAAIAAFRENYNKAKPRILEPIMKLSIEMPSEFRGTVLGSVNQRRGVVVDTLVDQQFTQIDAEIPLSEVFGYATILRSLTQGKAEFTLEFSRYEKVPKSIEEKIQFEIAQKDKQK